ncbi:MAG: hypothetical protein K1Y01_08275 [Vicinamibacteria bacterium]|nr:hypothetical protein [Vicinamibacteria bacterium]
MEFSPLHQAVLYLPVISTCCCVFFATVLFRRFAQKGAGPHLFWWGLGMVTYGMGTFTEAFTSLVGWNETVFRCWYVAGAFLGGYPLAQGSAYLHLGRKSANRWAYLWVSVIILASIAVFLAPIDPTLAEQHRLSGSVIQWKWVRLVSPFINTWSMIFLVGGAAVSARRFKQDARFKGRFIGNVLIATGGMLPGIGGSLTRVGYVEALYITELMGLILIYLGYRSCLASPAVVAIPRPMAPVAA